MQQTKTIAIIGTTKETLYGFRCDLIKELVNRGNKVYAFAVDYDAKYEKMVKDLGAIPVTYYLNKSGLNPFQDFIAVIKLKQQLETIKPDIVFSYFSKPVIYGTLAAKLAKVPFIVGMLEGLGYTFTEQPNGISIKTKIIRNIQILLYRLAFPFLDRLIFLNPDDPIDLLEKYNILVKDVKILGGIGLNLDNYSYVPAKDHQPVTFLFIARLLAEKGIREFLQAAQKVKALYPDTHFVVLGSLDKENLGALSEHELQEMINMQIIEYPGYVENIPAWIEAASVFVLPSYYREGVPRSTQEAMAIGRPIITTDGPGCRETVVEGVNGFLIPPWNVEYLIQKMIYFIENPKQIRIMGDESYAIAQKKFDAIEVNQRLIDILVIQ